jgi:hypothetical protein
MECANGALDRDFRDRIVSQGDAHELLVAHHPERAESDAHVIASLWEFCLDVQLPGSFLCCGRQKSPQEHRQKAND